MSGKVMGMKPQGDISGYLVGALIAVLLVLGIITLIDGWPL